MPRNHLILLLSCTLAAMHQVVSAQPYILFGTIPQFGNFDRQLCNTTAIGLGLIGGTVAPLVEGFFPTSLNPSRSVQTASGQVIAPNVTTFLTGTLSMSFGDAGLCGAASRFWSGKNPDYSSSGSTCNGWTDGSGSATATLGNCDVTTGWVNSASFSQCWNARPLICIYDPPVTSAPSRAPTQSPTRATISMVSTTVSSGGCGASTPVAQPFLKADGSCTPLGGNTAARATCTNNTASIRLYTNDPGTCTSATNDLFPTACQTVGLPSPFGTLNMGFGMQCDKYIPENVLQITAYVGSCSSGTEPVVTYMLLNTCIVPPRLPISGNLPQPTGSFRFTAVSSGSTILLKNEMWNSLDCSGTPMNTFSTRMEAGDGGAVVGCVSGDPHKFGSHRSSFSNGRLLQSVSTEYKLLSTPTSLTADSSAESSLKVNFVLKVLCVLTLLYVSSTSALLA